jgi:hypothetical protein
MSHQELGHGHGRGRSRGRSGQKGRRRGVGRGNVRIAVLALLTEEPMQVATNGSQEQVT